MTIKTFHAPQFVEPMHQGFCTVLDYRHPQLKLRHSHDFHEIVLVTSGEASHEVNGNIHHLKKGSLILLTPKDEHRFLTPISENFKFYNMIILESLLRNTLSYLEIDVRGLFPHQNNTAHLLTEDLNTKQFDTMNRRFDKMCHYPKKHHQKYNQALKLCLMEIFSLLFFSSTTIENSTVPLWLADLKKLMYEKENYKEGVSAMQKLSNCTKEHLSRSFKKYFDQSPTGFVNSIRLEEAAVRITYSSDAIIDISEDLGFGNLSHFYHLFKKKYGLSPKMYRTASRNQKI